MVTWTKNLRSGKYDVISPANVVVGDVVNVSRKDGRTTRVTIDSVSRPFVAKFGDLKGQSAVICRVTRMAVKDVEPETPRAITLRTSKPASVIIDAVNVAPSVSSRVNRQTTPRNAKTRTMAF